MRRLNGSAMLRTSLALSTVVLVAILVFHRSGQTNAENKDIVVVNGKAFAKSAAASNGQFRRDVPSDQDQSKNFDSQDLMEINRRLKEISGGRGPGVFIIPDTNKEEAASIRRDVNSFRTVAYGMVPLIAKAGNQDGVKLKRPGDFAGDHSIHIKPYDLSGTGLAKATLAGYTVGGTYLDEGNGAKGTDGGRTGWTAVTRVFDDYPHLDRVVFEEMDVASGHAVVQVPESAINHKVGPYPATATRMQDTSGNTLSTVKWIEDGSRIMSLKTVNTDFLSVEELKRLAENIYRSRYER